MAVSQVVLDDGLEVLKSLRRGQLQLPAHVYQRPEQLLIEVLVPSLLLDAF